MFCVNCGKEVTQGTSYCHGCGHPLPNSTPKDRSRFWFYAIIFLMIAGLIYSGVFLFTANNVHPIVKKQIKAIREGRVTEAYYAFTSRDFQAKTPLSGFRTFIKEHPEFEKNQSIKMLKANLGDNAGTVQSTLISQEGNRIEVEFHLIKEDGEWKILNIQLLESKGAPTDKEELRSIISKQLKFLKEEEIFAAYYTFGSQTFQKSTPLAAFQEMIAYFPLLAKHKKFSVDKSFVEGDFAKLLITLSALKETLNIEYLFEKNGGEWKIQGMQIAKANGAEGPLEALEGQIKAIRDHEFVKAYYEFTSKSYQRKHSYRDFVHFVKGQRVLHENRTANFSPPVLKGKRVFFEGELTSMNFDKGSVKVAMIEEGKQWKLSHLEMSE